MNEALKIDDSIKEMKELDQIEKNDTWNLVPRPKKKNVIETKWVFKNKQMKMVKFSRIRED